MKSTGIIRRVDELGRIVIPIELRRVLDIEERDEMEIYMDNDKIVLKKYESNCVFCSSTQGLVSYHDKFICKDCMRNIRDH
jgi:transcriptional pleiotropic regulator of transition state genes